MDEKVAKKQGALYRTDLVTKLNDIDPNQIKRQKMLEEKLG